MLVIIPPFVNRGRALGVFLCYFFITYRKLIYMTHLETT